MGLEVDQSRRPEGVLSTVDGLTEGLGRQDGGRGVAGNRERPGCGF